MVTTMKNLYTLRCCLEMAFNHAEVLGTGDKELFFNAYSEVLDLYYKENELLKRFMGGVYLKRPDNTRTYCLTNN